VFSELCRKNVSKLRIKEIRVTTKSLSALRFTKFSEFYLNQCTHKMQEISSGTETIGIIGIALAVKSYAERVATTETLY